MGQKTDARIFRQGINKKNWESKYIEKNNEESSLYVYRTLETQKYLNQIFRLYRIKVHNCKIFYSDSSLEIFLSFYLTTKTFYAIKKSIIKYSRKLSANFKPTHSKKKKRRNWKKFKYKTFRTKLFKSPFLKLDAKNSRKLKNRKLKVFSNIDSQPFIDLASFQEILLKSLKIYTKNKISISITMQNLNCSKQLTKMQIENLKQIFKQLRNFAKNSFFKEAINILFISISKRNSAKVLAEFLSDQFRLNQLKTDQTNISRKDNYFLGFLKQTIILLVKSDTSCLTGVKIVIKGRFNRAPRARANCIQFGRFSLQSFKSKIDYYQSTAYTVNGTFGIKVWLCESDS